VEIARQGGKNELSAQLEVLLLTLYAGASRNLIKCSPTFKPQTVISMTRLKDRLNDAGFAGIWVPEMGYIIRLGNARAIFLSAEESSSVVGNTAHLLLEVDESQDVGKEKYSKEFKPMGATTNCTVVHWGTTWDESTLLEEIKQGNLELEKKDGIRRHFRYDWQEVAKYNPDYLKYVEAERTRLGEDHPLFMTQYRLLPVHGGGGFLSTAQREQLAGSHNREEWGAEGKVYIAGIDLAGEAENENMPVSSDTGHRHDETVITIGRLEFTGNSDFAPQSRIFIVRHYRWQGRKHAELYPQMVDILKNIWHCKRIVVDATGIGEPVAAFLKQALGSRVIPFKFTAAAKSDLGFRLLALINAGGLKMYAADGSGEYREFWLQMERAKSVYRPNRTMNFYVEPSRGHDDFLMSLALLVEASRDFEPRTARGS